METLFDLHCYIMKFVYPQKLGYFSLCNFVPNSGQLDKISPQQVVDIQLGDIHSSSVVGFL